MSDTFIGHQIKLKKLEKTGIILELNKLSTEKFVEKFLISYDDESIIERINSEEIIIGEMVHKTIFFNRILRDIQSTNDLTREYASSILCDFLEFDIKDFKIEELIIGVETIINQVKVENNINVEHKLVEGLFEFIWHKKLDKTKEVELLERLTKIDKFYIWSYLGDEILEDIDNYNSKILSDYRTKNFDKWKEKDIEIYGLEKTTEYYNKLKK